MGAFGKCTYGTFSVILHIISDHVCSPTYPREVRESLAKPTEEAGESFKLSLNQIVVHNAFKMCL